MYEFHTPVLLQEVIDGLNVRTGNRYIDATLGGGGHGLEILKKGGIVLGIDVDNDAIEYVKGRWKIETGKWNVKEENLTLVRGNFKDIGAIAKVHGFEKVDGILFDLGVSLHQLRAGERGFSFQEDGPLDMRMDKTLTVTAADLVNGLYKNELTRLFEKFGEERDAGRIADAICRSRELAKITTTGQLADVVLSVKRYEDSKRGRIHPATQVFQALRIAVNDELGSIEKALPQAIDLLEKGGRIAVISFHSLEDRFIKHFFGKDALTKKPVVPSEEEVVHNTRARSAKLRIYEKT